MPEELIPRDHRPSSGDPGTIGGEITPPPEVPATMTAAAQILTDDVGFDRMRVRALQQDIGHLHQRSLFVEWRTRTTDRGRSRSLDLLTELAELGFSWRDVAKLIGVSVPAVRKWRLGENVTGESRRKIASLIAACDLIASHYEVRDIASWFEMPIVAGIPVTPTELYVQNGADLVFEYASGHVDPEQILTEFDPGWRGRYQSDFEVFRSEDGDLSIRSSER